MTCKIDMRALRECVNSCVGTAGAMHANGRTANSLEGALEMILNCFSIRLALPARKRPSVVRDN